MSARRSRMSIGPGSLAPLGDASSRANRRTSFGGANNNSDGNDGTNDGSKKDRRAMLEEWRIPKHCPARFLNRNRMLWTILIDFAFLPRDLNSFVAS